MSKKLPLYLTKCPIEEAIFEVRFSSIFPDDAVFGVFYQILNKTFQGATAIPLPILQMPEAVRKLDQNLKYQAYHRLQNVNESISVGPRVLTFSIQKPYIGWTKWSKNINLVLKELITANVFKVVERTGLRYINVFEKSVFDIALIKVNISDKIIQQQPTTLRCELTSNNLLTVLQIANNLEITSGTKKFIGSAIDIDVINNLNLSNIDFKAQVKGLLKNSHQEAKITFFGLLSEEHLKVLEPVYAE